MICNSDIARPVTVKNNGRTLKNSLRCLAGLLLFSSYAGFGATTADLTLAWDASVDPEVAGYVLYYGTASQNYFYSTNIGSATTCTLSDLTRGTTYFFAVTAYNSSEIESTFSDEIAYQIPLFPQARILSAIPIGPVGLELTWKSIEGSLYRVAFKDNITDPNWTDLSTDILAAGPTASWIDITAPGSPSRFYAIRSF